jgi:hypothetical protein
MKYIFIYIIKAYRIIISPFLPDACRFYPTCSAYSIEAIEKFGIFTGIWFSIKRILKCHPFHPGGYDPIPERKNEKFGG